MRRGQDRFRNDRNLIAHPDPEPRRPETVIIAHYIVQFSAAGSAVHPGIALSGG